MMSQSSVHRPVSLLRALRLGALASAASALVTIVSQEGLRDDLARAYSYGPNNSLDDAQSATLTYLFAIAICGCAGFWAFTTQTVRRRRGALYAASAAFILGTALAVYNATQPFPVGIRVAGLAPSVIGVASLVLLARARQAPRP